MPTMANITVKNAANADVIYVAKVPSAGDKTPAVWIQDAAHAIVGFRPVFDVQTRTNGSGNGRILTATLRFPVIQTVNSVDSVAAICPWTITGTIPTNVDATKVQDAFVQLGNLAASALIRSAASDGYAPT